MELARNKVIAKRTQLEHNDAGPPPLVHAKISSTARVRMRTTSAVSAPPSSQAPGLRPVIAIARRSPSPSKMLHPTISKVKERTRHGSISSVALLPTAQSSSSVPMTPIGSLFQNSVTSPPPSNSSQDSIRVKAKVSGLVKNQSASMGYISSVPPSLSSILSPPPPTSNTAFHRRSTSQAAPSHVISLLTSPSVSTLSFSSHSSTSASSQSHTSSVSAVSPLSVSNMRTESQSNVMSSLVENNALPVPPPITPQSESVARVPSRTRVSGRRSSISSSISLLTTGSAPAEDADTVTDAEDDGRDGENMDDVELSRTENDQTLDDERAEAKSNRKIADLEITTRSLLAINASIEATKVKQARELRELRRRLRETRLMLPPRTFRRLCDTNDASSNDPSPEESEEEGGGDRDDETFSRLRTLVEGMLDTGRKALAVACPAPHLARLDSISSERMGTAEVLGWERGGKHGVAIGSRVLSPEEAGWWDGEGRDTPVGDEQLKEPKDTLVEYESSHLGNAEN